MARYWPTPNAMKDMPALNGDLHDEIQKLKSASSHDMVILGSNSIVSQLPHENLMDEFQMLVNPVILGRKGRY
jgi:dihydrofolate reductase